MHTPYDLLPELTRERVEHLRSEAQRSRLLANAEAPPEHETPELTIIQTSPPVRRLIPIRLP